MVSISSSTMPLWCLITIWQVDHSFLPFNGQSIKGNVMRKLMCSQLEVNAASHVVVTQVFIFPSKTKDHLSQYFLPLIRRAASLPGGRATVINLADPLGSIEMSDGATARNATVYRMSKVLPSSFLLPSSLLPLRQLWICSLVHWELI